MDFTLQVGSESQNVTVNTGQILLNSVNAEISNVIDQTTITQLPLNGRDPAGLIFLSPGVTNVLNTPAGRLPTSAAFPNEVGGSSNGGRQGSTYALLDGVPNMDIHDLLMNPFPNPDATNTFRAVTNNYSVQYGFSRPLSSTSKAIPELTTSMAASSSSFAMAISTPRTTSAAKSMA